jgi:predicted lipid-binding transport protein (Tim44 family)
MSQKQSECPPAPLVSHASMIPEPTIPARAGQFRAQTEQIECEAEPFERPRTKPSVNTGHLGPIAAVLLVGLGLAFTAVVLTGVSLLAFASRLIRAPWGVKPRNGIFARRATARRFPRH